jgi:hypothetical protein
MDVWVILQLSAPGVEHTEEAGSIGAEEARHCRAAAYLNPSIERTATRKPLSAHVNR